MDDRLQKFARLVEIGSYSKASQELHISQPALSLAIHKLERELKTPLLIRDARKLTLTPAGRLAYNAAKEQAVTITNLQTELADLAQQRPKVAIGLVDSVAAQLSLATSVLDHLETKADASIVVNNSRYLRQAVIDRKIDVALVINDHQIYPLLSTHSVGAESLVLVCHVSELSMVQKQMKERRAIKFISYDDSSTTYNLIENSLNKLRIKRRLILSSTSPDVMLQMVLHKRGAAVLPLAFVQSHLKHKQLAIVKFQQPVIIPRPIVAVTLKNAHLPQAISQFLTQSKTILQ